MDILQTQQGGCEPDFDDDGGDSEGEVERGWFCCPNGHRQRYTNNVLKVTEDLLVKTSHRAEQAEAKVATLTEKLKRVEADRDKYERKYTRLRMMVFVRGQRRSVVLSPARPSTPSARPRCAERLGRVTGGRGIDARPPSTIPSAARRLLLAERLSFASLPQGGAYEVKNG